MKKLLFLFFLLSACTGGVTGGGGDLAPPSGGIGADNPPPVVVAGVAGASGSDGVLGSQSSSSDIEVHFFRDYALDFEGETDIQDVVVERPMVQSTQAYGDATVRKIKGAIKSLGTPTSNSTSTTVGVSNFQAVSLQSWVRAINCGNFPDSEIEPLIPPSEQGQPWAQDKLLWLILHLPRPDSPVTVECRNPTYRDFPVETLQKVDLAALKGSPQDLFFFVRVNLSDFGPAGELSLDAEKPLSADQWLEISKKSKLRIVRLLPAGSTSRVHAIPAAHLNPN